MKVFKNLAEEVKKLRSELVSSKQELDEVKREKDQLKKAVNSTRQAANINAYKLIELKLYGRRENLRIIGIAKNINSTGDDGKEKLIEVANDLGIVLQSSDLQRVHRLGRKKLCQHPSHDPS